MILLSFKIIRDKKRGLIYNLNVIAHGVIFSWTKYTNLKLRVLHLIWISSIEGDEFIFFLAVWFLGSLKGL